MPRGKKVGGRDFKPGQSGNPRGRPPLSREARELRALTSDQYIKLVTKFFHMTRSEFEEAQQNPLATKLEIFVMKIIQEGEKRGDQWRLEALLNRVIGPVKKTVEVDANGTLADLVAKYG